MTADNGTGQIKRMLVKMAAGAAVGAGATVLFFELFGKRNLDLDDPGVGLAIIGGLIFLLFGLFVGLGVAAPGAGARFLNVENADELRDQRKMLSLNALSCLLIGILLVVLAASGEGMVIGRATGAVVAGLCFAGVILLAIATRKLPDELMTRISQEASSLTLHIALLLFGGWAALAHLGYAEWVAPLTLLAGLVLIELLAIMWVSARKGLLTER